MAFYVPQMPLAVNIWHGGGAGGAYASPNITTVGNLTPGKRVNTTLGTGTTAPQGYMDMQLLLPKLTDVRAAWNSLAADVVEVPAGSHRFYYVIYVDDVAKGFANEHRFAVLSYSMEGWAIFSLVAPIPMP
jgi:hypothetical protein